MPPDRTAFDGMPDFSARQQSKPKLLINNGNLPATARALRDLFVECGDLFERDTPVQVVRSGSDAGIRAVPLTISSVIMKAHDLCQPIVISRNEEEKPVTLPERVVRMYLDMFGEWNLPPLVGISTAPLLTPNGAIRDTVGYDRATGLWCCKVPALDIPERVRRDEAVAALRTIREAFRTFPFADALRLRDPFLRAEVVDIDQPPDQDESAFLAGLLTAICRPSLWLAPGFLAVAPQVSGAGVGKGLLVRAICLIAFGSHPRAFTAGHDRQELDKRFVAELIEATPALFLERECRGPAIGDLGIGAD